MARPERYVVTSPTERLTLARTIALALLARHNEAL
jgi:hypothetical protein